MPPTRYAPIRRGNEATPRQHRDPAAPEPIIEFGRFRVLVRQRELLADGQPVELGARAFDLLLALIEGGGLLVTKEELINRVWPGRIVEDNNLTVQIMALRKALGSDRHMIQTEFGRGYRFLAARARSTLGAATSGLTTETAPPISDATGGTVPASCRRSGGNGAPDGFDRRNRWQMRHPRATDRWWRAFAARAGRACARDNSAA
jgi:DNA-binding winged helix-turn-helix (wHTH) protein